MLQEIYQKPFDQQHDILLEEFENWKGNQAQLDDLLVIGFKYSSSLKIKTNKKDEKWGDKHILIVEDTDVNYFLISEVLRNTGVEISRAVNGMEAVEFCKNNNPDLILMDINMPVMDGNTATRAIKSEKKHIPIIAQTAVSDENGQETSLEAGCDDFISKPIDLKTFMATIEKHLFIS
ncbi:MAG: response regulator [Bacteroidales bacterium]|nr:response regulator [Bacteroidales bacterium]